MVENKAQADQPPELSDEEKKLITDFLAKAGVEESIIEGVYFHIRELSNVHKNSGAHNALAFSAVVIASLIAFLDYLGHQDRYTKEFHVLFEGVTEKWMAHLNSKQGTVRPDEAVH